MQITKYLGWLEPKQEAPHRLSLLWSKGISQACDFRGPRDYWLDDTESTRSPAFFKQHYSQASGLVWVRLGSRRGDPCDLDAFAHAALPNIRKPFCLITTDGDMSVPSDLNRQTVDALLGNPFLLSWYTQNFDGGRSARIRPFPIGLDLHTRKVWSNPRQRPARLRGIATQRPALEASPLKVFCDLGVSVASRDRRDAVLTLRGCDHVDIIRRRISQTAIWRRYARYPFVLSARGNGLDCHRTWEILYLGGIVITRKSSLDSLYDGLPVVLVDDWQAVRDKANLREWLDRFGPLADRDRVWRRLRPDRYLEPARKELAARDGARLGMDMI